MLNSMFLHHSSIYDMCCMYSLDNYLLFVVAKELRPLGVKGDSHYERVDIFFFLSFFEKLMNSPAKSLRNRM